MTKTELITSYLEEQATDKEIDFIYNLLALNKFSSKHDLLELAGKQSKNMDFDTAFPIDLYRHIEVIYKGINGANLIYDYTNNKFGELININNLIVKNILTLKK